MNSIYFVFQKKHNPENAKHIVTAAQIYTNMKHKQNKQYIFKGT